MKSIIFTTALAVCASPLFADEYQPAMESYLQSGISGWMNNPVLIQAIKTQNARTADFDQATIDALDLTWRAEVGSAGSQIIEGVTNNDAANFLRDQLEA